MWEAPACEPPLGQVLAVVEVVLQKTKGHTFTITFLAYVDLSQERPVEFQARALYLDTHETVIIRHEPKQLLIHLILAAAAPIAG